MTKITLSEVAKDRAIKAWQKKFGTDPDIESPEFKAFHKELSRQSNQKYKIQSITSDSLNTFSDKLMQIADKAPDRFPQELSNAFSNLKRKDQAELLTMISSDDKVKRNFDPWINLLMGVLNVNKSESLESVLNAFKESVNPNNHSKYPWLRSLINQRITMKEDDFDLNSLDIPAISGSTSTQTTSTDTMDIDVETPEETPMDGNDSDLDSVDDFVPDDVPHIAPAGSYTPEEDEDDEEAGNYNPAAPEYRIIDVVFDEENPENSPKVKVKDAKTGEISVKSLYEIDVK